MGRIFQTIRGRPTRKCIPHVGPGRRGDASKIDCGCSAFKGGACCGGYGRHAVQGLRRLSAYHVGTKWERWREGFEASHGPHVQCGAGQTLGMGIKNRMFSGPILSSGEVGACPNAWRMCRWGVQAVIQDGSGSLTIPVASHGWRWCSTSMADESSTSMTVMLHISLVASC